MTKWLEDSLTFYASYHHNTLNKLVHIVCVWPILFTAQTFLLYASFPKALAAFFPAAVNPSWSLVLSLLYGSYYFFIEQPGIGGPIASALVALGYYANEQLFVQYPETIWKVALVAHIGCWIAQIAAHQIFEKRSPAFLDNIVQALVMAPLFVVLEVIFPLGYKPELHKKVEIAAVKNIAEFRKSQKQK